MPGFDDYISLSSSLVVLILSLQIDTMRRCMKVKRRYITLVKKARHALDTATAAGTGGTSASATFSATEEVELRRIEESIPIQALLVFRQFAAYEMVSDAKREEREMQKGKKLMASFGWTSNALGSTERNTSSASSVLRERGAGKALNASSSVSSWFKFNLKKSKRLKVNENTSSSSGLQNQKYSKALEKPVEIDEYENGDDEDDRLIALIQSRLDLDPTAADQFIFRLVLNGSAALRLSSECRPVALLELSMSSTTEMKADGIGVTFALDDFHLIDECTVNPLIKYLITAATDPPQPLFRHTDPDPPPAVQKRTKPKGPVNPFLLLPPEPEPDPAPTPFPTSGPLKKRRKSVPSNAPKLLFVMDSRHGKTLLRLTVRPMEATWNELCVGRLLGIFMSPDVTHKASEMSASAPSSSSFSPLLAASMNKFAMDAALPIAGEMELVIEIDAPKIIIPDDCFRDSGCLLADTGYLVIRGEGPAGYMQCVKRRSQFDVSQHHF
jgi:hypothetical protein